MNMPILKLCTCINCAVNSIWIYLFVFCQQNIQSSLHIVYFSLLFNTALDTRLNCLPFMSSPLSMFILVAIYLYIVRNGKKWMQHRNPMEIQQIIVVYNIVQIIVNSALFLVVSSLYCKWMTFRINSTGQLECTNWWDAEEHLLCIWIRRKN